jgi:hypothetical protein
MFAGLQQAVWKNNWLDKQQQLSSSHFTALLQCDSAIKVLLSKSGGESIRFNTCKKNLITQLMQPIESQASTVSVDHYKMVEPPLEPWVTD